MYKLIAVWLLSFFLFTWWGADLQAIDTSDPAPGDYKVRIEGFLQFPDVQFYQVSEQNALISVKRIRTNTVTFVNEINPNSTRISYNPKLRKLKENLKYDVTDLSLVLDDDLHVEADEVIVNRSGGLNGFSTITDYYRVRTVPATARLDEKEYSIQFYKRIYDTPEFSIQATGNLNIIPDFIKNHTAMNSLLVTGSGLSFNPKQLNLLSDYVRSIGKSHRIVGDNVEYNEKSIYAWENTEIQNIKFASEKPPKPSEVKPATSHRKPAPGNARQSVPETTQAMNARKFWISLLCSLLIECILMLLLVLYWTEYKDSIGTRAAEVLLITLLGTIVTTPLVKWVFVLPGFPYAIYVTLSGLFVILTESWWYQTMLRIPAKRALQFSITANLAALWCGIIIYYYMLDWML